MPTTEEKVLVFLIKHKRPIILGVLALAAVLVVIQILYNLLTKIGSSVFIFFAVVLIAAIMAFFMMQEANQ